MKNGQIIKTTKKIAWLISSIENPDPGELLACNRRHWAIEIMHRDKDVTLGEDHYTNRLDHAPQNVFTLLSSVRTLLKRHNKSLIKAIEMMQDNREIAIQLITGGKIFQ